MKKSLFGSREVLITLIDVPERIDRMEIDPDYINELANSIKEQGLLQPILLRVKGERFELIAGHRRLLAVKTIGLIEIEAIAKEMTDEQALLARAVENLQRVDLTVIEEARVYQAMHVTLGMSFDEIARRLGKGPGMVRRKYSLLDMHPKLIEAMHRKQVIYSVAEELQKLPNEAAILYYLGLCVDHGATMGVVRAWVSDELAKVRTRELEIAGSRGQAIIPKSTPVYVPCDLCQGPMKIGDEVVIRACNDCVKKLNEVLEGVN